MKPHDTASQPPWNQPLGDLARALRARTLSSEALTAAYLERIAARGNEFHAYAEVFASQALAAARASDLRLASGLPVGILEGVPIAVKDLAAVEGYRTMAGSSVYRQRQPATQTATVVQRLLAAGAVLLGKTHLVEFAFGGWGTNQALGTPRNPWDLATHRSPGGSSSGSAVAVAAGLAAGAIGTDTGGSVRIPSAFCGLTGLKTTQGRISNHGFDLVSHTLDTVGPMAWTAEDAALLLQAIHGPDAHDPATWQAPPEDFIGQLARPVQGLRYTVIGQDALGDVQPAIQEGVRQAAEILSGLGCLKHDAACQRVDFAADQQETGGIIAAEAYAGHGEHILAALDTGDAASRARVLRGRDWDAPRYAAALEQRSQRKREFRELFEATDVLVLPTLPVQAQPVATLDENDLAPSRLTRFVGYYGLCAIALPCGLTPDGLPMSVQLVAAPWREGILLRLGTAFQRATAFHRLRPAL
ncbi:amidase [Bordetella sp. BOR01]|uniref:amidase n=1 Tax=Bordetella sp. BOR01 TaxID=2854779 RepID=UPI001C4466CC|nr:amidase [Bordetella sp. BOR01]MBV7485321.1 amidase [Bordetella sp. BOR01]